MFQLVINFLKPNTRSHNNVMGNNRDGTYTYIQPPIRSKRQLVFCSITDKCLFVYRFIKTATNVVSALRFGSFANMELAFICVVVAAMSAVSATPHGYGVKGGAAAKADASAAAGAISGVAGFPLTGSLPHGGDFSGSYSKSSSSSFASSSASSSSSSFSFSGSGLPGSSGCTTGVCPNSGPHNLNGNSFQFNNAANAAAVAAQAQGISLAGSSPSSSCVGNSCGNQNKPDCNGLNCGANSGSETKCESGTCQPGSSQSSDDCKSGQCRAASNSFPKNNNFELNTNSPQEKNPENCHTGNCAKPSLSSPESPGTPNCASGNCGNVPYEHTATGQAVRGPEQGHKNLPNSDGLTPTKHQASSDYSGKCSPGQCKPNSENEAPYPKPDDNNDIPVNIAGASSSKTNYKIDDHTNQDDKSFENHGAPSGCAHGKCESTQGFGSTPNYPSGATNINPYNTKPDAPKCTSTNCNNDIGNPHAVAASGATILSYDKPSTYLTAPKHEPCTSPSCNPSGGSPGQHYSSSFLSCTSGNCDNRLFSPSSVSNYPKTENDSPSICTSGNCAPNTHGSPITPSTHGLNSSPHSPTIGSSYYPTSHSQSSSLPGTYSPSSPQGSLPSAPNNLFTQQNTYNTGYKSASPHGFSSSGSSIGAFPTGSAHSTPINSAHNNAGSIPDFVPLTPANCANGNCAGNLPSSPNFGSISRPTGPIPSHIPGSPSNCVNGNCAGSSPSSPNFGSISRPTGPIPSHIPGSPSNCVNGNCAESSPSSPNFGSISRPTGPIPSHVPGSFSNCVNGNCAGSSLSSPNFESISGPTRPIASHVPGSPSDCVNGNCVGTSPSSPNFGSISGPTGPLPSQVPGSPSNCVNGNCAGNSVSKPISRPIGSISSNVPLSPSNCANGNCVGHPPSKPSFPPTSGSTYPSYAGQPHGSVVPTISNYPTIPHTGSNSAANSVAGAHDSNSKPGIPSGKDKPYTGGFGGPAGLLKPNEHNIPNNLLSASKNPLLTGEYNSGICSSGKCHTQSSIASTGSQNKPLGIHSPATCTTGNCDAQLTQTGTVILSGSHTGAAASASANAAAYSGGFGGPPGFLKPFDSSKTGKSISEGLVGKHPFNSHFGSGQDNDLSKEAQAGAATQAGAAARAVAIAGSSAGAYGGHYGLGTNEYKNSEGCGGGCSGNGANGDLPNFDLNGGLSAAGAAAKAGAVSGSGAPGYGGSFASSSASAYASAGAAVKGGYGRR